MVKTGLDILVHQRRELVRGRRVGLVTHPAAVRPDLTGALDALRSASVQVVALFGPEHGLDGAAADGTPVGDAVHPRTGLPVYSLYGPTKELPTRTGAPLGTKITCCSRGVCNPAPGAAGNIPAASTNLFTKEPTPAMLDGVDVLVCDVQDVGARFYTFISTLFHVLRGAAKAGRPVIVLDRPNPINGLSVEGPLVEPGLASFVGIAPIPIRHGLTVGELAHYFNDLPPLLAGEGPGVRCDLTVVEMYGWRRDMWFDETGRPWVPTSPAMPHLSTATVYPGTCLVEGTNLSEGRGTALPFEVVGAPWLDGYALAQALNGLGLPGVRFRPTRFVPSASKFAGQSCGGVQVHVTDRDVFRPVVTGLHLIAACRAQQPDRFAFLPSSWEGQPPHFDLLMGTARVRQGFEAGVPVDVLVQTWVADTDRFERARRAYWLYH